METISCSSRRTTKDRPVELFIPRDRSSLSIPPMFRQNVTSSARFFAYHSLNLSAISSISVSLHWEIRPLAKNLS